MVAFVQIWESIWLLPRTAEGLQKLLQTYALHTPFRCSASQSTSVTDLFYFPCCLASEVPQGET